MDTITRHLFSLADTTFRDFTAPLIPNIAPQNVIGVRVPQIRAYAKQLAGDPLATTFLNALPHTYLEENILHAALIPCVTKDFETTLRLIEQFLPYIDCWAVCDVGVPKIFLKHRDALYAKVLEWAQSERLYTVRFALVTSMQLYLADDFRPQLLDIFASVPAGDYYLDMGLAWFFSVALVKQYDATLPLLQNRTLATWVHNKTIRKAIESRRIDDDKKQYLRSLAIPNTRK